MKLKQILLSLGSTAKVIAKIETKKAIESDERLEEIVKASDGIMVARGDMAVEAGAEVVPIIQRKLIAMCRAHAKLCIVATQMLSSMVDNPEPTRAEVSDVATAVVQGADVVMLSDETANGKYPVETVKEMKKVISTIAIVVGSLALLSVVAPIMIGAILEIQMKAQIAGSVGIIGGADGPTAVMVTGVSSMGSVVLEAVIGCILMIAGIWGVRKCKK